MTLQRDRQWPITDDNQINRPVVNPDGNGCKGFQQLIEALDRVQPAYRDYDQCVIGDGQLPTQWPQHLGHSGSAGGDKIADVKNPLWRESMLDQVIMDTRAVDDPSMGMAVAMWCVIAAEPSDMHWLLPKRQASQPSGPAHIGLHDVRLILPDRLADLPARPYIPNPAHRDINPGNLRVNLGGSQAIRDGHRQRHMTALMQGVHQSGVKQLGAAQPFAADNMRRYDHGLLLDRTVTRCKAPY